MTEPPATKAGAANDKLALHYAGIHRQEDRDSRQATSAADQEKKFWHMIRVRVPAGELSASQYLALDELASKVTYNRSLRVTAGQSVQLHGVSSDDLQFTLRALAEAGLAAGCDPAGFEFAIAASPVPVENAAYIQMRGLAAALCDEFYPRPGSKFAGIIPAHAPKKFSVGIGIPEDASANIFANDVGLLLVPGENGAFNAVNVYAGGSLSMPTRRSDTYARLATPMGSVPCERASLVIKAIATVFKRHGNLPSRRHTRLKYVVDELGLKNFQREVEEELRFRFDDIVDCELSPPPAWRGARDQENGEFFYGLGVPYGRIQDTGLARYKSAIRLIVEAFRPRVILAPDQNILFANLRIEQIEPLERILAAYHIPFGENLSNVRFAAMACAGLPTCPLSVAESERAAPQLVDELEAELERIGRKNAPFTFRISGCAIGCIRPNMVDLGVVGRKPGHYDLFVGGSEATGTFGELYAECVPLDAIVPTVRPILEFWAKHSDEGESFGDFYAEWFGTAEKRLRLSVAQCTPARGEVEQQIRRLNEIDSKARVAEELPDVHEFFQISD